MGASEVTGLTYNEINIIVFYIVIPLSWIYLYELQKKSYKFTISAITFYVLAVIILSLIYGFKYFSNILFATSVHFLYQFPFTNKPDYDYVIASVVICVFVPILIYISLIKRNYAIIKRNWKMITLGIIIINAFVSYGIVKLLTKYGVTN